MRTGLLLLLLLSGCADTVLEENTTYRRLRDEFDSKDHCLAQGDFTPCYQTLLLCADGRTVIDLENAPQRGTYRLESSIAVASLLTRRIEFDLETTSSEQLPGRHPWERFEPIFASCDE